MLADPSAVARAGKGLTCGGSCCDIGDVCVTPGGCRSDDAKAFCCAGTACGDKCCSAGYECKTTGSGRYMTQQCVLKCAARLTSILSANP